MPDTTAERLQRHMKTERRNIAGTVRLIPLANGRTISVQASSSHYSVPRDSFGPWTSFEVGTHWDHPMLDRYLGSRDDYKADGLRVFPWVPASVVVEVIDANGGFAS